MSQNPLFPSNSPSGDEAANLIRQKVADLYDSEPDAAEELIEATTVSHRSKHQQYMYDLSTSGKDLATVQTQWHEYYQNLPSHEKHEVWEEFYSSQRTVARAAAPTTSIAETPAVTPKRAHKARKKVKDVRSVEDVRSTIRDNVTAGGKLKAKHHVQSLLFGLSMGAVVLVVILFGLFNEVVLAPLYQPSRHASATPIIVDPSGVAPSDKHEVIIPKINLEIPVDFTQTTVDETVIEQALENGIVHYPTTSKPGQNGNAAYFGHSSGNLFNKGKYKFAFVLLHAMSIDDTFYITYEKKVYVYKVISKTIVDPSEVGVLDPIPGQTATATLITCDPPGTSLRRLVVVGQQISPDPAQNTAGTPQVTTITDSAVALPGNGRTLAGRIMSSTPAKIMLIVGGLAVVGYILRRLSR